jgi:hypothetical protein
MKGDIRLLWSNNKHQSTASIATWPTACPSVGNRVPHSHSGKQSRNLCPIDRILRATFQHGINGELKVRTAGRNRRQQASTAVPVLARVRSEKMSHFREEVLHVFTVQCVNAWHYAICSQLVEAHGPREVE